MTTTAYERLTAALIAAGCTVDDRGDHGSASTPGHSPDDRGTVFRRTTDGVLLWVHNGDRDHVLEQLGLRMVDLFDSPATDYVYSDGRKVTRYYDDRGRKRFGQGGNKSGTALFNIENLPADMSAPVFVVEGEKDVRALAAIGAVAVSPPQGANTPVDRWDWTPLHGRPVLVVRDMDDVGLAHAHQVVAALEEHAAVAMVEPATGKDAADHVAAGHEIHEFVAVQPTPPEGVRRYSDVLGDWWQWLNAPPSTRRVYPTPWEPLNDALSGGLHPKRTYVFAGRPGAGKTISVLNVAQHIAEQGVPTLVCSLEMPELEMASRLVAAGAGAHYGQITKREVDEMHMRRIEIYMTSGRVDDTDLWLLDHSAMTIEAIRDTAAQMQRSVGLGLLAVDHVGLVKPSRPGMTRREVIGHASWQCSVMAKQLDIPVIIASQLNRGPEQGNVPPQPSDLKESGDLEQNADVVLLLHHPKVDGLPTGDVELILGKNRTGPAPTVVTLPWRGQMARIG
ncbi:AAA family ATPase [Nocardia cyriacigeorgica]|uniref:DnaB-like helicase C-terminal domain-containing protein n=1 Tax=Nocardia cyriacigeorgica TaxID=135487 RepID=UPI001892D546|nr:DnaB-like helicase C-terminal domain-containing protein [Nocardia cyriacigeorgica]MBF6085140.1 AAA family ATPase [Nocardia cyriacigeorgica]